MIISENGIVVGKLDQETLQLVDIVSARLQQLVDDWRENGFTEPAPAEISRRLLRPKAGLRYDVHSDPVRQAIPRHDRKQTADSRVRRAAGLAA